MSKRKQPDFYQGDISRRKPLGSSSTVIQDQIDELDQYALSEDIICCFRFLSLDPVSALESLDSLLRSRGIRNVENCLLAARCLEALNVDTFWILHLNGIIQFAHYIDIVEKRKTADYIRNTFASTSSKAPGDSSNTFIQQPQVDDPDVTRSICSDIVHWTFSTLQKDGESSGLRAKCRHILESTFLLSEKGTILHPVDIRLFCDLLSILSCDSNHTAVIEWQVSQMARLLSFQVDCSRESKPLECLFALRLPAVVYLRALDRALRANERAPVYTLDTEGNGDSVQPTGIISLDYSEISKMNNNTAPGVLPVLALVLEACSREGVFDWKRTMPSVLTADEIAVSTSSSNHQSSTSLFPLVAAVYLAMGAAKAGVAESSTSLWLHAVCLMEQVALVFQHEPTIAVSAAGRQKINPGMAIFASWLDAILGPKAGFGGSAGDGVDDKRDEDNGMMKNNDLDDFRASAVYSEMGHFFGDILGTTGLSGSLSSDGHAAVYDAKSLEFACLALISCVSYHREEVLQVICQSLRARRGLIKDTVDIYLLAARERLREIDRMREATGESASSGTSGGGGGGKLADLTPDRIESWASTVNRTGCLPVSVSQACMIAGSSEALLRAMKVLSLSNPALREHCFVVVKAMVEATPRQLCTNEEAQRFIGGASGAKKSGPAEHLNDFLNDLNLPSTSMKIGIIDAIKVVTHAAEAIAEKNTYQDAMQADSLSAWKAACRASLTDSLVDPPQEKYEAGSRAELRMKKLQIASFLFTALLDIVKPVIKAYNKSSAQLMTNPEGGRSNIQQQDFIHKWMVWFRQSLAILVGTDRDIVSNVTAASFVSNMKDLCEMRMQQSSSTSMLSVIGSPQPSPGAIKHIRSTVVWLAACVEGDHLLFLLKTALDRLLSSKSNDSHSSSAMKIAHERATLMMSICDVLYRAIELLHSSPARASNIAVDNPLLCASFVWIHARCASHPVWWRIYATSDTNRAANMDSVCEFHPGKWAQMAMELVLSSSASVSTSPSSVSGISQILGGEWFRFFLEKEIESICSRDTYLFIDDACRATTLQRVFRILLLAHSSSHRQSAATVTTATELKSVWQALIEVVTQVADTAHSTECLTLGVNQFSSVDEVEIVNSEKPLSSTGGRSGCEVPVAAKTVVKSLVTVLVEEVVQSRMSASDANEIALDGLLMPWTLATEEWLSFHSHTGGYDEAAVQAVLLAYVEFLLQVQKKVRSNDSSLRLSITWLCWLVSTLPQKLQVSAIQLLNGFTYPSLEEFVVRVQGGSCAQRSVLPPSLAAVYVPIASAHRRSRDSSFLPLPSAASEVAEIVEKLINYTRHGDAGIDGSTDRVRDVSNLLNLSGLGDAGYILQAVGWSQIRCLCFSSLQDATFGGSGAGVGQLAVALEEICTMVTSACNQISHPVHAIERENSPPNAATLLTISSSISISALPLQFCGAVLASCLWHLSASGAHLYRASGGGVSGRLSNRDYAQRDAKVAALCRNLAAGCLATMYSWAFRTVSACNDEMLTSYKGASNVGLSVDAVVESIVTEELERQCPPPVTQEALRRLRETAASVASRRNCV